MSILSKLFGSRNIENQKNKKFQELEGKNSISETLELGMVLIPAGEFEMGTSNAEKQALINLTLWNNWCDNELPEHTVYLDAFYLDKYEVTNAQYAKFLNAYGKNVDAAGHELLDIDDSLIEKVGGAYQPKAGYGNHPVVAVSWYGAAAYAQFYAQRLPTEAEWEKAARGGLVGKRYPWGDDITHDDANYSGTGDGTSPVGSFPPNGYGLYDVAGNVWEWCADEYDDEYYSQSQKKNPKGPGVAVTFQKHDFTNVISMRVLRGGALTYPYFLRCSYRGRFNADNSSADVGFRCARDL